MSQSFVLCPIDPPAGSTSTLPAAPPLHLLPFSLGPNGAPYKSTTAPIGDFFQPRLCPSDVSGIASGTPIASFRGRQVVGQSISVPRGYRGVILQTSEAPAVASSVRTSQDVGPSDGRQAKGKWPLTPASSAASASTASVATLSEDGTDHLSHNVAGVATRSSPRKVSWMTRVKGAGQIALSRPKTRQAVGSVKKRKFRLDSDDEGDAEGEGEAPPTPKRPAMTMDPMDDEGPPSRVLPPARTPSKRLRASQSIPLSPTIPKEGLPAIILQTPTPRKDPGPPRIRRLPRGARSADYVIPGSLTHAPSHDDVPTRSSSLRALDGFASDETVMDPTEGGTPMTREESTIIPSPATENDPPAFDVEPPSPAMREPEAEVVAVKREEEGEGEREDEWTLGSQRRLKAVSTFDSITLWTPDVPLAGWGKEAVSVTSGEVRNPEATQVEGGVRVRAGWWPSGGAGEGGDEFVRAMGEYLGLMEVLNKPVYLDDGGEKDDESDDDV